MEQGYHRVRIHHEMKIEDSGLASGKRDLHRQELTLVAFSRRDIAMSLWVVAAYIGLFAFASLAVAFMLTQPEKPVTRPGPPSESD
jgi:hypothetical protein